jgi:membrane protein YdbS with pleckstrin-like domain
MTVIDLKTKACPFCAETIQEAAIKCRFCGEFLNTKKANALLAASSNSDTQSSGDGQLGESVLFAGRPSLWGLVPAMIMGGILLAVAGVMVRMPLEDMVNNWLDLELAEDRALEIGRYRVLAGLALGAIVLLVLILKVVMLKAVYYEVTADRVEWSRGILDRKVDNLDMFRVVDLKMRRNLLDCVFGIGTVALITTDKTDPNFVFRKMKNSRALYDIIKRASLNADRRTNVVHLE